MHVFCISQAICIKSISVNFHALAIVIASKIIIMNFSIQKKNIKSNSKYYDIQIKLLFSKRHKVKFVVKKQVS